MITSLALLRIISPLIYEQTRPVLSPVRKFMTATPLHYVAVSDFILMQNRKWRYTSPIFARSEAYNSSAICDPDFRRQLSRVARKTWPALNHRQDLPRLYLIYSYHHDVTPAQNYSRSYRCLYLNNDFCFITPLKTEMNIHFPRNNLRQFELADIILDGGKSAWESEETAMKLLMWEIKLGNPRGSTDGEKPTLHLQ